ncbi:MAG: Fic family protein [Opitutaceae bacterium]|nr:Fic family protein [Opitutaceae bacterium]
MQDLGKIGTGLLGTTAGGWVRRGTQRAIIAGRMFGSAADRLPQELVCLASQSAKVRSADFVAADLCAAAFFHLRFVHIHPLIDGNGRVGRLLLAVQCGRIASRHPGEILSQLQELSEDYQMVFSGPTDGVKFDLMVYLLARILAVSVVESLSSPFPLAPVFPERDSRPAANMKHVPEARSRRSRFF